MFGVPTLLNASQKDGAGLMALCIGMWTVIMLAIWATVTGWTKRRGPLGARFDVGPEGIQVHSDGTPTLIKRSDIHLVEIFNGWTNQSVTSSQSAGVYMGSGAGGVIGGAAFMGVAGVATLGSASRVKAEKRNADVAYQVRYRVRGKAYPVVGGLSLATAQEVFWHITEADPM
jgi:hypothetical protein